MDTTSASLLERLRVSGDQEAWSKLVDLYSPLLLFWARKAGLARADAEDLVQEVFAVLVRKLPQFQYDRGRGFRNWLRTITLNKWRDVCRRRARRAGLSDEPLGDVVEPPPEDLTDAEYRAQLVARALELIESDFEPTTWRAFQQTAVLGRVPAEVAAELGVTRNVVYLARCRVLRRLRDELDGLIE